MEVKGIIKQFLFSDKLKEILPLRETDYNAVFVLDFFLEKKVLRVSKRLDLADLHFELEAIEYLNGRKIPVAMWDQTIDGKPYAVLDDGTIGVVFDFVDGYHVQIDKNHYPTPGEAFAAGNALGEFHAASKDFVPNVKRSRTNFTELEKVLLQGDEFRRKYGDGDEFVANAKTMLAFGKSDKSLFGLIQNDYRSHNVFFENESKVGAIIDFDWSCYGHLVADLALGVLEWSFPDGASEPNMEVFDCFLDGYNTTAPAAQEKGSYLYNWIAYMALDGAATYLCNNLKEIDYDDRIRSYMYGKFKYFKKIGS